MSWGGKNLGINARRRVSFRVSRNRVKRDGQEIHSVALVPVHITQPHNLTAAQSQTSQNGFAGSLVTQL